MRCLVGWLDIIETTTWEDAIMLMSKNYSLLPPDTIFMNESKLSQLLRYFEDFKSAINILDDTLKNPFDTDEVTKVFLTLLTLFATQSCC